MKLIANAPQYEFYAMYVRLTNGPETNISVKFLLPSIWLKLIDVAENLLPPPADGAHLTLLCPLMEGGSSSATSVHLYQNTLRHIPKYNIHIVSPRTSTTNNSPQDSGKGHPFLSTVLMGGQIGTLLLKRTNLNFGYHNLLYEYVCMLLAS